MYPERPKISSRSKSFGGTTEPPSRSELTRQPIHECGSTANVRSRKLKSDGSSRCYSGAALARSVKNPWPQLVCD